MLPIDIENYEEIEIQGKKVKLPPPEDVSGVVDYQFIGREEIIEFALSAWAKVDRIKPFNFRLYGPPGSGKNAIVYELARMLKKDLYIISGNDEFGPEDITCSATMESGNKIKYVGSPLFAAMLRGGICFFDEIGKVPSRALATLASVLDARRRITSTLAAISFRAHDEFLFCAALNIDEEGIGLPGFIDQRTRPAFYVGYPSVSEVEGILKTHMPPASELWIRVFIDRFKDIELPVRNVIQILGLAHKLYTNDLDSAKGKKDAGREENGNPTPNVDLIKKYIERAYKLIIQSVNGKDINDNPEEDKNAIFRIFRNKEKSMHQN